MPVTEMDDAFFGQNDRATTVTVRAPEVSSRYLVSDQTEGTTENETFPDGCVVLQVSDFVPWDHPGNLISIEVEQMFDMIVAVVFLNILFLVSAPTNIICMIAFCKQGIKERINLCLFCQSLADLLYMTINFLLYADRIYLEITGGPRRGPLFRFVLNNDLVGFYGFSTASGFMSTVIACERCFCVLSPFRSQTVLKTKTMLCIIIWAFVITVGGFFVIGTRWSVVCVFDPRTNIASPEIYPREFYLKNKQLIDILDGVVYGIALPGIFVFATMISCVVTVMRLKKMAAWREKTSSSVLTSRDVALTRMLIGTSILFVVCTIPGVVFRTLVLFVPDVSLGGHYHNTFTFMVSVVELFSYVNSTVNFFVYYSVGSKFKDTVRGLFRMDRVPATTTATVSTIDGN